MLAFSLLALLACGGDPVAETAAAPAVAQVPVPATPEPAHGDPSASAPAGTGDATAGKSVYDTHCMACHQADGSGMNGMLAANFKADPTRLAKPDEVLLASIRDGYKGKVGQMPPWGSVLSPQQQVDVLAYVRATFGGGQAAP